MTGAVIEMNAFFIQAPNACYQYRATTAHRIFTTGVRNGEMEISFVELSRSWYLRSTVAPSRPHQCIAVFMPASSASRPCAVLAAMPMPAISSPSCPGAAGTPYFNAPFEGTAC